MTLAAVGNKLSVQVAGTPSRSSPADRGLPCFSFMAVEALGPSTPPAARSPTGARCTLPPPRFLRHSQPGWVYSITDVAHFVLELAGELGLTTMYWQGTP